MSEREPGPGPNIRINGVVYPTVYTEHGVLRYVENKLFTFLVDSGRFDLNWLAFQYHGGKFSAREYMEFNMGLGYSVSGLCDFHVFFGEPDGGMFSGEGWTVEVQDEDGSWRDY